MSLKRHDLDAAKSAITTDRSATTLGSDKDCSAPSSRSDSDSSQRAQRIGLIGGRYKTYTIAEKLDSRTVHQPSGCWDVLGYALHSGHVQISTGSPWNPPYIRVRAHVFAWERAMGQKVPIGKVVMHSCDNPRCVNPDHLSIGTQRDNILDSIRKGRYNVFGRQKLNAVQVLEIRALAEQGMKHKDIGAKYGIKRHSVTAIVNRKSWAHLDPATSHRRSA